MPFGEETIHHFERLYSHKLGLTVTVTVMALLVAPTIFKAFLAAILLLQGLLSCPLAALQTQLA